MEEPDPLPYDEHTPNVTGTVISDELTNIAIIDDNGKIKPVKNDA